MLLKLGFNPLGREMMQIMQLCHSLHRVFYESRQYADQCIFSIKKSLCDAFLEGRWGKLKIKRDLTEFSFGAKSIASGLWLSWESTMEAAAWFRLMFLSWASQNE